MATDELPTIAELAGRANSELRLALDPQGTGSVDLHDGSRLTALVSMQTGLAARVVRYAAARAAAARASTSEGDDLDIVARDDYGEERKGEARATGKIQLLRASGGDATSIPQGTRFAVPATDSTPSVVFLARATVPVLAGETLVTVNVQAQDAGEGGNLGAPGTVTQILDTLPDTGWSVTSPPTGATFAGGAVRESDDVLRARLLQIGTEDNDQRGTRLAVLAGALRVRGVRYAIAVEPGNGSIALFIGDSNYAMNADVAAAVRTELLSWRCFGVPVDVRYFDVVELDIVATVYMARPLENYSVAALAVAAEGKVRAYFAARPHPDEYYLDRIRGALGDAHPEVQHVVLATPSADAGRVADAGYADVLAATVTRVRTGGVRLTFANPLTA